MIHFGINYRSGLNTIPHNAKIHYNYANYLKDHGRVPEAISHYRNAVMLVPYSGKIWQGKSSELRCTDRPRLKVYLKIWSDLI